MGVLMDDELAMELGADIHGSVADARDIFGEQVTNHSILLAHGSSTPKNRTTESEIFDRVAKAFGINDWPVVAIKAFLGHSLAPASGDQVTATLGMFKHKWLPGIKTADAIADDVFDERLSLFLQDQLFEGDLDVAFINSKGFGGANGTAIMVSPDKTEQMLEKRYGKERFLRYQQAREKTRLRRKRKDVERNEKITTNNEQPVIQKIQD